MCEHTTIAREASSLIRKGVQIALTPFEEKSPLVVVFLAITLLIVNTCANPGSNQSKFHDFGLKFPVDFFLTVCRKTHGYFN